jgi:hypothetical protein
LFSLVILQGLICFSSLIGIGEIVLLPLDVLKIKRQTNPEAFRGRGVLRIVRDEGFGLYRGWGWTAARNAPGSFAVSTINPHIVFIANKDSSSVDLRLPRGTSLDCQIITRQHGFRTSSPPSLVLRLPCWYQPLLTLSRPESRTEILRTQRADSGSLPV